ncbi:MAG: histidine ammonia-lyase, partial [Microbacterium sp. 13-71-7]
VIEADGTDLAFHKRWHRITGSGNWIDPSTGRRHGPENPLFPGGASA